jgi:hypothetical protein
MSREWYGYLVRALNEFASLTAQCDSTNVARPVPIKTESSTESPMQRMTKKSRGTGRRRRSR